MRQILILAAALSCSLVAFAQKNDSPEVLLGRGLHQEEVEGNCKAAVETYQKVLQQKNAARNVAARAQLHLGSCQETLGNAESRKSFERVVQEYADQKEVVTLARARLGNSVSSAAAKSDRAVWTGPKVGYILGGTISSDGRFLSSTDGSGNLAVHDFTTGSDRVLTNQGYLTGEFHDGPSAISRDGKRIAYRWFGDEKRNELRIVEVQGSTLPRPRRLLLDREDITDVRPFDWSPDGRWIAVHVRRADRSGQIALVATADGALKVLKSIGWNGPSKICISPDGRYIAYDLPADNTGRLRNIFVLAIDGSRETTASSDANGLMAWSPDGKHLLFSRGVGLFALPFDDGKVQGTATLLRTDPATASLGISSSGTLYTVRWILDYQLRIASLDWKSGKFTAAPTTLQEPPGSASFLPTWSPDGKFLAYVYNGSFIKIRSLETGETRELRPDLEYFIRPRWSPDSRSFLVAGRDVMGRPGAYKIDAQSGATSRLMTGSINFQDIDGNALPVWSPDGKFIYFVRAGKIMERDVTSGKEREIISGVPGEFNISPDGRYIAAKSGCTSGSCNVLLLIPVAGGDHRELLRVSPPEGILPAWSVDWTPDSTAVLVIKETAQRRELWQIPIAGGQPRRLDIDIANWANGQGGFSISPDGRQMAFTAGQNAYEIWALENVLPAAKAGK